MAMSEKQRERLRTLRGEQDFMVTLADEKGAKAINEIPDLIRPWVPGVYAVGDVRRDAFFIPYKCIQGHDSTNNPDWTPATQAALWMQYHGTSRATARAWVRPTMSEDMYRTGEWMIYTDGVYYECVSDTVYSPDEYPSAWRKDESE